MSKGFIKQKRLTKSSENPKRPLPPQYMAFLTSLVKTNNPKLYILVIASRPTTGMVPKKLTKTQEGEPDFTIPRILDDGKHHRMAT